MIIKLYKLLPLFLTLFCFIACKKEYKKSSNIVNETWIGKKILFPPNPVFTQLLTDTVSFNFSQSTFKILTYADTIGCMGCKLQLDKWKEFISTVKSATAGKDTISFLFFFYPKDIEELNFLISSESFNYPICIDHNDQINKLNKFSSDRSFLLDKNNYVVAEGNPILDCNVKTSFLEIISRKKNPTTVLHTEAEIEDNVFDLGTFRKGEIKEVTAKIKNTGVNPLVIIDLTTSCGCIKTLFDKRPIPTGNVTQVIFKVKITEEGYFKKTVKVNGNINKPIIITIQGNVIERK